MKLFITKIVKEMLAAILISIPTSLFLYMAPIILFPFILVGVIASHGVFGFIDGSYVTEIYSTVYFWCHWLCTAILGMIFLIRISTTNATEIESLAYIKTKTERGDSIFFIRRWLLAYYLKVNSRVLDEYIAFKNLPLETKNEYPEFKDYLRFHKSPYLGWYEKTEMKTSSWGWIGADFVNGFYRRGHYRNTKHGMIYIRSHSVSPHNRRRSN